MFYVLLLALKVYPQFQFKLIDLHPAGAERLVIITTKQRGRLPSQPPASRTHLTSCCLPKYCSNSNMLHLCAQQLSCIISAAPTAQRKWWCLPQRTSVLRQTAGGTPGKKLNSLPHTINFCIAMHMIGPDFLFPPCLERGRCSCFCYPLQPLDECVWECFRLMPVIDWWWCS